MKKVRYKGLAGTEVIYTNIVGEVQQRVVVGIDPLLGITIAELKEDGCMLCITPAMYGGGYAGAFLEAVRKIEIGVLSIHDVNDYAISGHRSKVHGSGLGPICPFM